MMRYGRTILIISLTGLAAGLLTRCASDTGTNTTSRKKISYADFAGSASCISCHKDLVEKHAATAHFRTSMQADSATILGSFIPGKNSFAFSAVGQVVMEKRADSFYQVEYLMGKENRKSKFDITVGSGKKGQSYLSWKQHSLIQMPVTYFTPAASWSSSPGFNPHAIAFNRVVTSRCLECHSTFFETTSAPALHPETYNQSTVLFGVDCERCHGPAKEHVQFHAANPTVKEARYVVNTGKMSRQTNIDLCALCHSGKLNKSTPSFSFQAGDKLDDHFERVNIPAAPGGIDVHGNQLGMLAQSKCYSSSEMTCISCHNIHAKEQNQPALYSQRCIQCHTEGKTATCRLLKTEGPLINKNCIDCHMPLQPSQSITVYLEDATVPTAARLRTHQVGIYKEETKQVLAYLKKLK